MMKTLLVWIRFLRLPAVLTVPGDLWVGALVADRFASWQEVVGVSTAYLFGMGLNDWWDRERDGEARPERPIPSGGLRVHWAGGACVLMAGGAFALLPGVPMLLLLVTILAYTGLKTWNPLVGAILMGLCRYQSVWIGTGAGQAGVRAEWMVPLGAGVLIFLLTRLSQLEGTGKRATLRSGLFAAGLVMAAAAGMNLGGRQGPASWALLGTIAGVAIANHAAIERKKEVPPSAIGIYLGLWIPLQAIWVLGGGRAFAGAFLVAAAIALPWLQRQIAIS